MLALLRLFASSLLKTTPLHGGHRGFESGDLCKFTLQVGCSCFSRLSMSEYRMHCLKVGVRNVRIDFTGESRRS